VRWVVTGKQQANPAGFRDHARNTHLGVEIFRPLPKNKRHNKRHFSSHQSLSAAQHIHPPSIKPFPVFPVPLGFHFTAPHLISANAEYLTPSLADKNCTISRLTMPTKRKKQPLFPVRDCITVRGETSESEEKEARVSKVAKREQVSKRSVCWSDSLTRLLSGYGE